MGGGEDRKIGAAAAAETAATEADAPASSATVAG